MQKHRRQLDASIETSGPHDFTVRFERARPLHPKRPSHPAPNVRDDRDTPLLIGRGTARLVDLICPTAQVKGLRHNGTTGKSLEKCKILSSDEQLLELSLWEWKQCSHDASFGQMAPNHNQWSVKGLKLKVVADYSI